MHLLEQMTERVRNDPTHAVVPEADDLPALAARALGRLRLLLLLRVHLHDLQIVAGPVRELLVHVILPDLQARQMRLRPQHRILEIRRVHEVEEDRRPGVLLLHVIEHALAEIRDDHPASGSAGIDGLVVGDGVDALVVAGERAALILHGRDAALDAFQLAVEQERAESAGDGVVGEEAQVVVVELERHGELRLDLVHDVQELEEGGREAAVLGFGVQVAAVAETMPEGDPLLLDKHAETLDGPVVRVHAELGHRGDLGRHVPAVLQADCHRRALQVQQIDDGPGQLQDVLQLVQPLRVLD